MENVYAVLSYDDYDSPVIVGAFTKRECAEKLAAFYQSHDIQEVAINLAVPYPDGQKHYTIVMQNDGRVRHRFTSDPEPPEEYVFTQCRLETHWFEKDTEYFMLKVWAKDEEEAAATAREHVMELFMSDT